MKLEVVVEPSGGIIVSLSQGVHFGRGHVSRTREATMKLQWYKMKQMSKNLHGNACTTTMLYSSAWIFFELAGSLANSSPGSASPVHDGACQSHSSNSSH